MRRWSCCAPTCRARIWPRSVPSSARLARLTQSRPSRPPCRRAGPAGDLLESPQTWHVRRPVRPRAPARPAVRLFCVIASVPGVFCRAAAGAHCAASGRQGPSAAWRGPQPALGHAGSARPCQTLGLSALRARRRRRAWARWRRRCMARRARARRPRGAPPRPRRRPSARRSARVQRARASGATRRSGCWRRRWTASRRRGACACAVALG